MAIMTRRRTKPTYTQVLQAVRELAPQDQRRLHDELAKLSGVYLAQPNSNAAAIRRGRRLAKVVQGELTTALDGSLEETMTRLRGQAWSS
jgi:hypothetical protein